MSSHESPSAPVEESRAPSDSATSAESAHQNGQAPQSTEAARDVAAEMDSAGAKAKLRRQSALAAAGGLALAIVPWGGYSHRWSWTGINGATATLWDWLNLLLLPLVFSVLRCGSTAAPGYIREPR